MLVHEAVEVPDPHEPAVGLVAAGRRPRRCIEVGLGHSIEGRQPPAGDLVEPSRAAAGRPDGPAWTRPRPHWPRRSGFVMWPSCEMSATRSRVPAAASTRSRCMWLEHVVDRPSREAGGLPPTGRRSSERAERGDGPNSPRRRSMVSVLVDERSAPAPHRSAPCSGPRPGRRFPGRPGRRAPLAGWPLCC